MSNGYIISSRDKGICYIIDPGYEPKKFTGYVKEQELIPAAVLLTHHHHDHVGGAAKVADILDIPVMMSFEDSLMYKGKVDSYLQDGQILDLDGQPLMIRLTPGHTKGSLCMKLPKAGWCSPGIPYLTRTWGGQIWSAALRRIWSAPAPRS